MRIGKWLPWKIIVKRAAEAYGFLDPVTLLARLRRFGHPSEVHEPIELIRAGVVFHARGLINTRAIQYNLDWVWPYWIVKQFKPNDISFIPRGFAFSHVNLTHRNWTAVGLPQWPRYPIVDPRGLVTPYFDGWSIDFWVLSNTGDMLIPSENGDGDQHLRMDDDALSVSTSRRKPGLRLDTTVWVEQQGRRPPQIRVRAEGRVRDGGSLVLSLRPYNPEGIHFIETIAFDAGGPVFHINGQQTLRVDRKPSKTLFSTYADGDVARRLDRPESGRSVTCDIGMATAAALFPVDREGTSVVQATLPLLSAPEKRIPAKSGPAASQSGWRGSLAPTARLEVPDEKVRFLYDAAVRTLQLLTADEAYPGPYTYRRFWFRDACLMINALLAVGAVARARRMILDFPKRQTMTGYFRSQEGEWDSNGQVLWIAGRLFALTGVAYDGTFLDSLFKGADWIIDKRGKPNDDSLHRGLLPAGFSAEHLGPNDFYYWDNFWGTAGLAAAARMATAFCYPDRAVEYRRQSKAFFRDVWNSIARIPISRSRGAVPASPYRRMDAGAIGSLVADYPLQLIEPNNPMIMKTAAFLKANCFHSGAFFQDMIHAGINVYLTLAIGQTLLRAGDPTYRELMGTVAGLASPTGQWPEAIHPFTRGGCMGDGQHGWAAAEWVMMVRNLFVREEGDTVVVGSGILPEWLSDRQRIAFGPTPIPGGNLSVSLRRSGDDVTLVLDGHLAGGSMDALVAVPGFRHRRVAHLPQGPITLRRL